jgi:DNA-binding GntR family transcriptional regulator
MRVVTTSIESLLQGFEVRLMLEVPLARRATELKTAATAGDVRAAYERFRAAADAGDADATLRADRDFHRTLLSGSGNAKAVALLQEQRNLVLMGGVGTVPSSRSTVECFDDHLDIYTAFDAGNVDAIGSAMSRHISGTARMLIAQESRSRPEFGPVDAAERLAWLIH